MSAAFDYSELRRSSANSTTQHFMTLSRGVWVCNAVNISIAFSDPAAISGRNQNVRGIIAIIELNYFHCHMSISA